MKVFFYLCAGLLVVLAASWTYEVNYRAQETQARVNDLHRQIAREHEAIAVLQAEWAYLNRPTRLRALSEVYFVEMRHMPIHADSFGDTGMVAFPMENAEINDLVEQIVARDN